MHRNLLKNLKEQLIKNVIQDFNMWKVYLNDITVILKELSEN